MAYIVNSILSQAHHSIMHSDTQKYAKSEFQLNCKIGFEWILDVSISVALVVPVVLVVLVVLVIQVVLVVLVVLASAPRRCSGSIGAPVRW